MIYLSQLLGNPVYDLEGERIGRVSDLGIATGEVFPRVTALAVEGPGRTPLMISWRKYVDDFDEDEVSLKVVATDIRFSYLQPDEVLVARDLLNKQIVDTRGMRVVRVNDLKLSDTSSAQLRLLGAEVGTRGILRGFSDQNYAAVLFAPVRYLASKRGCGCAPADEPVSTCATTSEATDAERQLNELVQMLQYLLVAGE